MTNDEAMTQLLQLLELLEKKFDREAARLDALLAQQVQIRRRLEGLGSE